LAGTNEEWSTSLGKIVPKAVIDTNVLFGYKERNHFWQAATEGLYIPYWSPWIIGELYRTLTHDRIKKGHDYQRISRESKSMMRWMSPYWMTADPKPPYPHPWPNPRDKDDLPLFDAAKSVKVEYVVSHNADDFPPNHEFDGVNFVRPSAFFNLIGYEPIPE